jgi:hypothetical protein
VRSVIAIVVASALVGCGPHWPEKATTVTSPSFAKHANPITTVDVLPLDLEMWAEPGMAADIDQLRSSAEAKLMNTAFDTLASRSYAIGAVMDWNGDTSVGNALAKDDVQPTVAALARYGEAAQAHPGSLPVPYLPARLGTSTKSDATLYIGGWSYVADHHASTGEKIVEGVVIGLVVIAAIGIVYLAAEALSKNGSHSSSSSSSGSSAGGVHDHRAAIGGNDPPVVRDHRNGGDSGIDIVLRDHRGGGGGGGVHVDGGETHSSSHVDVDLAADTAMRVVDAFGREMEVLTSHPDWEEAPNAPHSGESQMYVEMTLVDNTTGLVLWHTHQIFPANAADGGDVQRVAQTLLASLPASR